MQMCVRCIPQAQTGDSLPSSFGSFVLPSRLFSSSALGTATASVEPTASTSYLLADDEASHGQCKTMQIDWETHTRFHMVTEAADICLTRGCMQVDLSDINLTPREVVERLDKYIVGQVRLQHLSSVHAIRLIMTCTQYSASFLCSDAVMLKKSCMSLSCMCQMTASLIRHTYPLYHWGLFATAYISMSYAHAHPFFQVCM